MFQKKKFTTKSIKLKVSTRQLVTKKIYRSLYGNKNLENPQNKKIFVCALVIHLRKNCFIFFGEGCVRLQIDVQRGGCLHSVKKSSRPIKIVSRSFSNFQSKFMNSVRPNERLRITNALSA